MSGSVHTSKGWHLPLMLGVNKSQLSFCIILGPDHWDEMHLVPDECHKKQSPINIIPHETKYDERLKNKPLQFVYDPSQATQLMNNGHSVQVIYNCEGSCKF